MAKINTSSTFLVPKNRFKQLNSPVSVGGGSNLLSPESSDGTYGFPTVDPANPLYQLLIQPANDDTIQQFYNYLGINLISGVPQVLKNATYTLILEDANKHLYKSDTSAYTWTIPANSAVAFEIGTCITFINGGSAGNITIAITTDTLRQISTGSTGSRTLAAYGMATALKVAATTWVINGTGLT